MSKYLSHPKWWIVLSIWTVISLLIPSVTWIALICTLATLAICFWIAHQISERNRRWKNGIKAIEKMGKKSLEKFMEKDTREKKSLESMISILSALLIWGSAALILYSTWYYNVSKIHPAFFSFQIGWSHALIFTLAGISALSGIWGWFLFSYQMSAGLNKYPPVEGIKKKWWEK